MIVEALYWIGLNGLNHISYVIYLLRPFSIYCKAWLLVFSEGKNIALLSSAHDRPSH